MQRGLGLSGLRGPEAVRHRLRHTVYRRRHRAPSNFYARVDGKAAEQVRIASGIFQWTIASNINPYGLTAGTYEAASDGLWGYLEKGLNKGNHTVQFGGHYEDTIFGIFEGTKVTYKLKAR
jgi:hypothetical protein